MNAEILKSSGNGISIDFTPVFDMLNDELAKHNESLRLICAGGYVLQFFWDCRRLWYIVSPSRDRDLSSVLCCSRADPISF